MPLIVGTDADLPPPLIGTDVPGSAPGIPQPVIVTGGESLPPSFPLGTAGTWMPPPLVGEGGNVPFPTPVVPPGSGVGQTQPIFVTGSPTNPLANSYFPNYAAPGPFQPIVLTNLMQIGPGPPPFTPGTQPITISSVPTIPQLPWNPNPDLPELPPVNTVRPQITPLGALQVGQSLAGSVGTWTTTAAPLTYARQWLRNGSPITGATGAGYTLIAADVGATIAMLVTATDAHGVEAGAEALPVGPILPAAPVNTGPPVISGVTQVFNILTVDPGSWNGSPAFTYVWLRGATPIAGATALTYELVSADLDAMISVTVTATNAGGSATATTPAVGPITTPADDPEPAPSRAATRHHTPAKRAKRR
jgi:hypothetical protein